MQKYHVNSQSGFNQILSPYGGIYPIGGRSFLDQFAGASAGYSLRQLSSSSTDVVRVRRSSDNAEQDFSANEVKGSALLDYVVPTDIQDLYNNAMYFGGVNDYITLTSEESFTGDFDISWKVLFLDFTKATMFGDSNIVSNDNFITMTSSSELLIRATDNNSFITLDSALDTHTIYTFRLVRSSNTITLYIDGVAQADTESNSSNLDLQNIGTGGYSGGTYMQGSIWDIDFGTTEIAGDGIDSGNWGGGTVNGSPALFTGQGFNGFVSTWYDQRVPTSNAGLIPVQATGNYAVATSVSGGLLNKRVTFKYVHNANVSGSQGFFGLIDGDGYRYDIYFATNNQIRVFNRHTTVEKSKYYDIPLGFTMDNDTVYEFDVEYGADNSAPSVVKVNGVSLTIPSSTSEVGTQIGNANKAYLHTIGASIGQNTYQGYNAIKDLKIYGTDKTTVEHSWALDNISSGLEDTVGSTDFVITGDYNRFNFTDANSISKDAIQETTANQPLIVENGALVTENGKPAIDWVSGDYLDTPAGRFDIDELSVFMTLTQGGSGERVLDTRGTGSSGTVQGWQVKSDNQADLSLFDNGAGSTIETEGPDSLTGQGLRTAIFTGTTLEDWNNGTSIDTDTGSTIDSKNGNALRIGSNLNGNNSQQFTGKLQEIIIYDSDQSANRIAIETNINNYYGIY